MKGLHFLLNFLKSSLLLILSWISLSVSGQESITIWDEEGQPLYGVEVFTSDYQVAEISDVNGQVTLTKGIEETKIVHLKYLGYKTLTLSLFEIRAAGSVISLSPGITLDEVTVVGRTNAAVGDMANSITSIDTKIFSLTNPQTAADALGKHADVYIQKSQMGGGSPIIRGFEANKVLLVLDGVRMNNAIYRSGHLQNAITVDNSMLESIEVIYGPGSLMYGSDALGGVVHFRSKSPKLTFSDQEPISVFGNYYARYASANSEKSLHFDLNSGGRKFGSLTSFSASKYGDLKSGNNRLEEYPSFGERPFSVEQVENEDVVVINQDPNVQIGTGYDQFDILQKFIYRVSKDFLLSANLQYSTSSDVPRYDNLSEIQHDGLPRFAEWYYGPQKRFFASLKADLYNENPFFEKAIIIAAFQNIHEDRINRRFQSLYRGQNEEEVSVLSLTADFFKPLPHVLNSEINYGLELNHNTVNSSAHEINILTDEINYGVFTRYPSGGSGLNNAAAFVHLKTPLTANLGNVFSGIRFTSTRLNVKYQNSDPFFWPENFYSGLNSSNQALTWSMGSNINMTPNTKLQLLVSSAFRSPNIDDLAKIRVQNDEVAVPNLELTPEKSINYELTVQQVIADKTKISLTGFYTSLTDAIVRKSYPFPDGTSFLVDGGDTLITVANINANSAKIYGLSLNFNSNLSKGFDLKASYNYVYGRSYDNSEIESPLSHIPPAYGSVGLKYARGKSKSQFLWVYNGEKPLSEFGGSEDNPEQATPEGTYAWSTLNINSQIPLYKSLFISLGVENLLDVHYRPFASGVSAPGRNFILSISGSF